MGKYNPRILVYVLVWSNGDYVCLDEESGYPLRAHLWHQAHFWTSEVEIKRYRLSFPNEGFKIEQILPSFIPE